VQSFIILYSASQAFTEKCGELTLKDRRVRANLVADKGVSGWVCEVKKAQPRLKNRRRLSEGVGEVIGGGMAGSRNFFLKNF
jgi:hypothetical protein